MTCRHVKCWVEQHPGLDQLIANVDEMLLVNRTGPTRDSRWSSCLRLQIPVTLKRNKGMESMYRPGWQGREELACLTQICTHRCPTPCVQAHHPHPSPPSCVATCAVFPHSPASGGPPGSPSGVAWQAKEPALEDARAQSPEQQCKDSMLSQEQIAAWVLKFCDSAMLEMHCCGLLLQACAAGPQAAKLYCRI